MRTVTSCRICQSGELTEFFNLGDMPLANGLLDSPDAPEERFPLNVLSCPSCGLVQLGHVVPAEKLYADYPFFTGSSKVMADHFRTLMAQNVEHYVPRDGLVVEIGANDGTALMSIKDTGRELVGVDPGFDTPHPEIGWSRKCFDPFVAATITASHYKQAHLIVACNVLGHVDDLHSFMRGVTELLHPDGAFVFEVPYTRKTLREGQFDQFYHEHISYMTLRPLARLMAMHGLSIAKSEFQPVHGGSARVTAVRSARAPDEHTQSIIVSECERMPVHIAAFRQKAEASRDALRAQMDYLDKNHDPVVGYCASAKGAVLLNYCGIDIELVRHVIDNTPAKLGKYMPGTHQHIIGFDAVMELFHAVLILSQNHAAEIKAKHPEFSGTWILPHEDNPA